METNTIDDLRAHLFDTIRALKDKSNPMEIERARAVCEVGSVIINTAKVEIEHARVLGGNPGTGFLLTQKDDPTTPNATTTPTATGTRTVQQIPGGSLTTHVMRG